MKSVWYQNSQILS